MADIAETVLAGVANIATCATIGGIVEGDSFTAIHVILIAVGGPSRAYKNALTSSLTRSNTSRTAGAQIATGTAIRSGAKGRLAAVRDRAVAVTKACVANRNASSISAHCFAMINDSGACSTTSIAPLGKDEFALEGARNQFHRAEVSAQCGHVDEGRGAGV